VNLIDCILMKELGSIWEGKMLPRRAARNSGP
jgi:hypothetical protein